MSYENEIEYTEETKKAHEIIKKREAERNSWICPHANINKTWDKFITILFPIILYFYINTLRGKHDELIFLFAFIGYMLPNTISRRDVDTGIVHSFFFMFITLILITLFFINSKANDITLFHVVVSYIMGYTLHLLLDALASFKKLCILNLFYPINIKLTQSHFKTTFTKILSNRIVAFLFIIIIYLIFLTIFIKSGLDIKFASKFIKPIFNWILKIEDYYIHIFS